jgi:hypothetical protein
VSVLKDKNGISKEERIASMRWSVFLVGNVLFGELIPLWLSMVGRYPSCHM